jgi:hypothetical protein
MVIGCGGSEPDDPGMTILSNSTPLSIDETGNKRKRARSDLSSIGSSNLAGDTTLATTIPVLKNSSTPTVIETAAVTTSSAATSSAATPSAATPSAATPSAATPSAATPSAATSGTGALGLLPLLSKDNFKYLGAFKLPKSAKIDPTYSIYNFGFSGGSVAFNPNNNSLFIVGNKAAQYVAEIKIPETISYNTLMDMPQASLIQDLADPTDAKLDSIDPTPSNGTRIGGLLVDGGSLLVGAYSFYDADYNQSASHFIRPTNLSAAGQSSSAIKISASISARWLGGYMTSVPTEWQPSMGGSAITGIAGIPIISNSSAGPAATSFDPAKLGSGGTYLLLGYPFENQLASQYGSNETSQNPIWNATSQARGAVFPASTRSVLFFGRHGLGLYCYGDGVQCNDPADPSKGTHAYPYAYQIWAYDALDLAGVKSGTKNPASLKPYAVWNFDLPFQENNPTKEIGGVAFDPSTRKIYITQLGTNLTGCCDYEPIIHVMQLR